MLSACLTLFGYMNWVRKASCMFQSSSKVKSAMELFAGEYAPVLDCSGRAEIARGIWTSEQEQKKRKRICVCLNMVGWLCLSKYGCLFTLLKVECCRRLSRVPVYLKELNPPWKLQRFTLPSLSSRDLLRRTQCEEEWSKFT